MRLCRLEAVPVRLGFRGVFRTSHGTLAVPGRTAEHVYVRAETDSGLVGWGEARPSRKWSYETLDSVTSTINRYFAPALLGRDPLDLPGAEAAMSAEIAPGFTTGQPIARSGVEMALWDLRGKHLGRSVNALLGGGEQRTIQLSWTVLGSEPEAVAESVREGQARGYGNFNFKVGFGLDVDRAIARTVAELAPGTFLWADANQAYDLEGAVQASRLLAEVGVALLEQPLPINRYLDYPHLRRRSALPIGVDEGICHPSDLEQLLRARAVDILVDKIG
ncbi:MAG: mandelate racemase, partial [Armatimonadetes bacterium]|nr:mandelate racemase [Armatimonadota bacterium]